MKLFEFFAAIAYEVFLAFARILTAAGVLACIAGAFVLNHQKLFFIGFSLVGGAMLLFVLAWLLRHFDRLPP